MGCGNPQEKLEDEMLNLKIARIELQMERYNQIQLLKEKQGTQVNTSTIPDYIDPKFLNNQIRRNSNITSIKEVNNFQIKRRSKSFKTNRSVSSLSSKNVKNTVPEKGKRRKSKSVHIHMEKIDEEDPNAPALKEKRKSIILGKTNKV